MRRWILRQELIWGLVCIVPGTTMLVFGDDPPWGGDCVSECRHVVVTSTNTQLYPLGSEVCVKCEVWEGDPPCRCPETWSFSIPGGGVTTRILVNPADPEDPDRTRACGMCPIPEP